MNFGRIKRSTYIIISLIIIGIYTYAYFFHVVFMNCLSVGLLVFYIIMALLAIVIIAGRLNDINVSGWFSLLALIPFLNFIFFILFFIEGTVGENKYGKDPKERIHYYRLHKAHITKQNPSYGIKEIERKLKLIKESYEVGILDQKEFETKKNELVENKKDIQKNQAKEQEFKLKKEKLITLFENNIISKTELDFKLKNLMKAYNYGETDIESADLDMNYYYFTRGKEYGPTTAKYIIDLLKNNKIKPETYIRFENEKLYNRKAFELIKQFE